MLSMASPFSASRSATCDGLTPMNSSVAAASYQVSSFIGLYMDTESSTSWSMSLSLDTITTSSSGLAHRFASVPMTSSASKPGYSRIGMRIASSTRRM